MPNQWLLKKKMEKKREKKNQKMCLKKNEKRYEHFFLFSLTIGFQDCYMFYCLVIIYFITVILLINSTWGREVY